MPIHPPLEPLVDHFSACVRQACEATQSILAQSANCKSPEARRQQWIEALGVQTDICLRSPAFLQMLKAHLEGLVAARRAKGESNEGSAASPTLDEPLLPPVAGDDPLLLRLERLERRIAKLESESDPVSELPASQPITPSRRGVTPYIVAHETTSFRLLRYSSELTQYREPILICFGLVNRPYILDLQAKRSVIRQMIDRGFDVYLIDWNPPTEDDSSLRLEDYVNEFLHQAIEIACEDAATEQLHLMGYCMGGTMSTMYAALRPERVRNLILMATPIDFSEDDGLLNLWSREEYFDVDAFIDAHGNCPGEFLQFCFQLMKPVRNFTEKYMLLSERLGDRQFIEDFLAMEQWAADTVPVAGQTFREFVKLLYQQNCLFKGRMKLADDEVKLASITCPLLLLVAEQDHLVPPKSTIALRQLVRSSEVKTLSIDAGHVGLAVGSKAHRQLWPDALHWIARHSSRWNSINSGT